jgi:hypothetical protein
MMEIGMILCRYLGLLTLLLLLAGCESTAPRYDIQPSRPDDVSLVARNLRYNAADGGYTFSYNEKRPLHPCEPTRWVYVRKDALVATKAVDSACISQGDDVTLVWLRGDWDQPPKPISREELDKIQSLPARSPGR